MAEYNPSKIIKDGNTYNFRDITKIPLTGTNALSGSIVPSTDNSVDLGSSSKNIKMLYTRGITINGTQFVPSDYATLSGLSTVATSGSYNDLSNTPTIPTVNDSTLTIQENGTTIDTFTANSSSDKTVNITIPTKTSDLNNDSGFITGVSWNDVTNKPTFATVATSGSYNDLSNKPTIPTVNDGTLTIKVNGETAGIFTANQATNEEINITTSSVEYATEAEITDTVLSEMNYLL